MPSMSADQRHISLFRARLFRIANFPVRLAQLELDWEPRMGQGHQTAHGCSKATGCKANVAAPAMRVPRLGFYQKWAGHVLTRLLQETSALRGSSSSIFLSTLLYKWNPHNILIHSFFRQPHSGRVSELYLGVWGGAGMTCFGEHRPLSSSFH